MRESLEANLFSLILLDELSFRLADAGIDAFLEWDLGAAVGAKISHD
jgi:hypothetical protein